MKFFTGLSAALLAILTLAVSPASADPFPETVTSAPLAISQAIGRADIDKVVAEYRTVVTSDFGGSLIGYIQKYNLWRQEGRKVQVDDLCMSACTLVTGLVPAENVCVSKVAKFAFHSAYTMSFAGPVFAKEGTRLLWNIYPDDLQKLLTERGWDGGEHPDFLYVKGTDLYELCQ